MTQCNKCTNDTEIEHSIGCRYEHFLSYSGNTHSTQLCMAYFHGRNASHEEYETYMKENSVQQSDPYKIGYKAGLEAAIQICESDRYEYEAGYSCSRAITELLTHGEE